MFVHVPLVKQTPDLGNVWQLLELIEREDLTNRLDILEEQVSLHEPLSLLGPVELFL
jgi:hypothetical protein